MNRMSESAHQENLLSAIRARRKPDVIVVKSDWRPIDTAPKDGTPMLFCYYDDPETDILPIVSGFWSRLGEHWYAELSGQKIKPTHWMPLLAPPRL